MIALLDFVLILARCLAAVGHDILCNPSVHVVRAFKPKSPLCRMFPRATTQQGMRESTQTECHGHSKRNKINCNVVVKFCTLLVKSTILEVGNSKLDRRSQTTSSLSGIFIGVAAYFSLV